MQEGIHSVIITKVELKSTPNGDLLLRLVLQSDMGEETPFGITLVPKNSRLFYNLCAGVGRTEEDLPKGTFRDKHKATAAFKRLFRGKTGRIHYTPPNPGWPWPMVRWLAPAETPTPDPWARVIVQGE